jgi:hypothetical protein
MRDRADKRWREPKGREEKELARRLLDQYVRKLTGIARVGLQGPHAALAKLALNELRAEFTAQQAGRIKNTYVRSLGVAAALFTALLLVAYAIVNNSLGMGWWYQHKAFLLAAGGASVGTWLSFSIRRVSLSFNDLAILDEDLLDPSVRIVFVIGLTLTACLLFWTGVMNIQIGDLKTNAADFANKGSSAMLVGVFLGISERSCDRDLRPRRRIRARHRGRLSARHAASSLVASDYLPSTKRDRRAPWLERSPSRRCWPNSPAFQLERQQPNSTPAKSRPRPARRGLPRPSFGYASGWRQAAHGVHRLRDRA